MRILRKLQNLYKIYFLRDPFLLEVRRWMHDLGDQTLRLDYPDLNKDSIVFDVGGYHGDYAYAINKKYGCRVYLFEPSPEFYYSCVDRFRENSAIICLNYGLAERDGHLPLSSMGDASSFMAASDEQSICELREYFSVIESLKVKKIDLMKINIEGGEFPLVQHILDNDDAQLVRNYQIQFHNFVDNAVELRQTLTEGLSKTHVRTWCYTFVWENWTEK